MDQKGNPAVVLEEIGCHGSAWIRMCYQNWYSRQEHTPENGSEERRVVILQFYIRSFQIDSQNHLRSVRGTEIEDHDRELRKML